MEIYDYSVKIEFNNNAGKSGSGILYVPREGKSAYIITVAHVFEEEITEGEIIINFGKIQGSNETKRTYEFERTDVKDNSQKSRVCILSGYDWENDNSPNDGAVLEIPYEEWMKRDGFGFGIASQGERLRGYGYPGSNEKIRDYFDATVVNSVHEDINWEETEYCIKFIPDEHKGTIQIDYSYLDEFSGTGFCYIKDGKQIFVGIFSRHIGTAPNIHITDSRKIYQLIIEMGSLKEPIFPMASYQYLGKKKIKKLDIVLKQLLESQDTYLHCLCGYVGTGKSYTVDYIINKYFSGQAEENWRKLTDCLSSRNMSELDGTIYILDPLEREWERELRDALQNNEENEELSDQIKLTAKDKLKLFEKIISRENDLKKNHIHILIIFRSNFLRDLKAYMIEQGRTEMWKFIDETMIYCDGYNDDQLLEFMQNGYSELIMGTAETKRPKWLLKYMDKMQGKAMKEKDPERFEFNMIRDTREWYYMHSNKDGTEEKISIMEIDKLENLRKNFLADKFKNNREAWEWNINKFLLLYVYPFKENEKGFRLDDKGLYAYLIAEELAEQVKCNSKQKFLEYIIVAYDIGRRDNEIGEKIRNFLAFFMEDLEGGGDTVVMWLSGGEYEDEKKWILDDLNLDYIFHGMSEDIKGKIDEMLIYEIYKNNKSNSRINEYEYNMSKSEKEVLEDKEIQLARKKN